MTVNGPLCTYSLGFRAHEVMMNGTNGTMLSAKVFALPGMMFVNNIIDLFTECEDGVRSLEFEDANGIPDKLALVNMIAHTMNSDAHKRWDF